MTSVRRIGLASLCACLVLSARLSASSCSPTTFVLAGHYLSGSTVYSFAVGDVDGDTVPDIVALTSGASLHVLLGVGDGTYVVGPSYPNFFAYSVGPLALTHVDGDNQLDLILADGNGVHVALGNGD